MRHRQIDAVAHINVMSVSRRTLARLMEPACQSAEQSQIGLATSEFDQLVRSMAGCSWGSIDKDEQGPSIGATLGIDLDAWSVRAFHAWGRRTSPRAALRIRRDTQSRRTRARAPACRLGARARMRLACCAGDYSAMRIIIAATSPRVQPACGSRATPPLPVRTPVETAHSTAPAA